MTKEELLKQKQELERQIKEIEEQEYNKKIEENTIKLDRLRDMKEIILPLLRHDRTSCSDENISNGYGSASYGARCNKCHLIEILNSPYNNEFEVELDVSIMRID